MLMISGRSSVNVPRLVFFPDLLESLPAIYIKKKVFKVAELMDLAEKKNHQNSLPVKKMATFRWRKIVMIINQFEKTTPQLYAL